MRDIDKTFGTVHVVILILSKIFFISVVWRMMLSGVKSKLRLEIPILFFPIILLEFNYDKENLSCFTTEEINCFKNQKCNTIL